MNAPNTDAPNTAATNAAATHTAATHTAATHTAATNTGDDAGGSPRLSVVVACHNAQDVLGVQLEALARQRCPVPWELLICDNGSDDDSVAVARSWADRLPLRIVVADSAPGAGPARNAGVEAARGEWIGFCDADDEVGDGWLEVLCAALAEHPFVAGSFEATRLNSPRTLRSRALDQQAGLQHSSDVVRLPHAGGGNLGIHRSIFVAVGGFDPAVRYLQDTDLCWRVQLSGVPLVFVPELVVHVRLRSTLRGMYRQGRNYGASLARLERTYAGRSALDRSTIDVSTTDVSTTDVLTTDVSTIDLSTVEVPAHSVATGGVATGAPDRPGLGGRLSTEHGRNATAAAPAAAAQNPSPPDGAPDVTSAVVLRRLRSVGRLGRGALRLARHFVVNRSSLGAQAWQIGWHIGHRS